MAGLELLSDQGYRVDGRRAGELRKIQARMGVFAQADGSAYIEQGNTKALAVVYGPHEVGPIETTSFTFRAVRPQARYCIQVAAQDLTDYGESSDWSLPAAPSTPLGK